MSRICCSPFCDARQPGPSSGLNADSIGKSGSSEVTSTVAIRARSIQCTPDGGVLPIRSELDPALLQDSVIPTKTISGECEGYLFQFVSHLSSKNAARYV